MRTKASTVKKERFKTVASKRVQRVLDAIDSLSKCANKYTYEYSDEDVKHMLKTINDRIALMKASFTSGTTPKKQTFHF